MTADHKPRRPTAYLLAGTLRDATASATADWGWKQIDADIFMTPSGKMVQAVTSDVALRGVPRGTTIYLGHDWVHARGAMLVRAMIRDKVLIDTDPEIYVAAGHG